MKKLMLLFLFPLFFACSHNATPGVALSDTPFYVDFHQYKNSSVIPKPPKADTKEDLADMNTLLDWQKKRTTAECDRASSEVEISFDNFYGKISPFPDPMPPEAKDFFDRVASDAEQSIHMLKRNFHRPRPYLRNEFLFPCVKKEKSDAYPSGHAMLSRLYALVLTDLVPARRAEFLKRADEIALDRVIGGVHHPSDIEAGKKLADDFYTKLLASPNYKSDVEKIQKLVASNPQKVTQ